MHGIRLIRALLGDSRERELHFVNDINGATAVTMTPEEWASRPHPAAVALIWPGETPRFWAWMSQDEALALAIAEAACRKMDEMRNLGAM